MAIRDLFRRKRTPEPQRPSMRDAPSAVGVPPLSSRDLPIADAYEWDNVQGVRAALTALHQGQFGPAAALLDAMLGDSHIVAKLDDRLDGLLGAPFSMRPPEGLEENAQAIDVAAAAMKAWPRVISDRAERMVMRDGLGLGLGLAEIIFELDDEGAWAARLKHWHLRHVYWRWDTRTYWVNTMKGTEELRPAPGGGYFSTWRDDAGVDNVSRWLLYTPYGYQRGWVNARVKALAIPWLLRNWAFRDWGRHSEIYGIPPRKLKMPAEWSDEEKQRALREVTALASESIIRCPQDKNGVGFDIELLEVKGTQGPDVFGNLIAKAEAAITVALVGQTLTTQNDQQGGSRSLGEVHERVAEALVRGDATAFAPALRACVLVPWTAVNVGNMEFTPWPTYQVEPPEDVKTKGEGLKAVGEGISALKRAGVPVDRAKVCEEVGIPVEEGAEFTDIIEPGPAPGAPGGEDDDDDDEGEGGDDDAARFSVALSARSEAAAARGQVYVDEVADHGRAAASRVLAPDVAELRRIVREATSYDDLRHRLVLAYRGMDASKLARLLERCLVLASLSGRHAVHQGTEGGK